MRAYDWNSVLKHRIPENGVFIIADGLTFGKKKICTKSGVVFCGICENKMEDS
jgi:hypothetical protein